MRGRRRVPEDPGLTAEKVTSFCREELAGYKKPREVVFVDDLPRNALGKVRKHRIREDSSERRSRIWTRQATSDVVREMAAAMEENKRYLNTARLEIGDGDHGNNMNRGFQAALDRLGGADASTPADVLKAVSMALISKVGAAGPLYGTAFLRASSALGDKEEISAEDAAQLKPPSAALSSAARPRWGQDYRRRPRARRRSSERGRLRGSVAGVFRSAADAAKEGAESTVPLTARRGRASYLGARAAGHQDPGATSTYMLAGCRGADAGGFLLMVGIVLSRTARRSPMARLTWSCRWQERWRSRPSEVTPTALRHGPERIEASINELEADEVLVFMDLGSAVLSAETVLEMLPPEKRERVTLVDAPFVEGAFAAGVTASTGADAEECRGGDGGPHGAEAAGRLEGFYGWAVCPFTFNWNARVHSPCGSHET